MDCRSVVANSGPFSRMHPAESSSVPLHNCVRQPPDKSREMVTPR
jgi:hypothetical protein